MVEADEVRAFIDAYVLKWYNLILVTLLVYYLHRRYIEHKFSKAYGCKRAPRFSIGPFGLGGLYQLLEAMRLGWALEFLMVQIGGAEFDHTTYDVSFAGKFILFTAEPEIIKAMLATQFNDFALGHRHAHFLPLLGDGIFTLDSHGWKNSRAMLRPQFSREQISHVKSLEPHVLTLANHMKNKKGQPFDIQDLFFKFTVDTATDILFGESVYCLRDGTVPEQPPEDGFKEREGFNEAFNYTQKMLAKRSYTQQFYFMIDSFGFRKACKQVHRFAKFYVNKALSMDDETLEKKSASSYTFLYELAKTTKDPKVLQDQLLNIMVAGRDTTAGLLSFTYFELARHPKIYNKLKEEIYKTFGRGSQEDIDSITFDKLKKCEYLKWVLNEVLRLYPSVPVNFRQAVKDTTLPVGGGKDGKSPVFVPKGGTVAYTVYCTHRLPEYYGGDSIHFKPERWESMPKLGWAYVPFNGGPRICLGQQFALTEASYVVVRLTQIFSSLESAYSGPDVPAKMLHLTLSLYDGCPVKMA